MYPHVTPKEIERFWKKVDRSGGPNACWPWIASRNTRGYGYASVDGKNRIAHRVAFLLEHGRLPQPCCLHTCDNPPCCNPAHLFEGTHADNARDMIAKGRMRITDHARVSGTQHPQAKLTPEVVKDIRARWDTGESQASLGRAYGVHISTVFAVVHRMTWDHVP